MNIINSKYNMLSWPQ